jgi:hypothetical protein
MSRLQDLVADTVSNRLFRTMRVTQVAERGPFREISLTSVAAWTPGDKIQLRVARDGLTMRTYTRWILVVTASTRPKRGSRLQGRSWQPPPTWRKYEPGSRSKNR